MAFNIDSNNEEGFENGVWTDFSGSQLCIANTGNMAYQRELSRLQQPYRKKVERGTLDPKTTKHILCKAIADAVLMDWKGVIDGKGKEVKFSKEVAYNALSNSEDLRDFVIDYATNYENYKIETVEDAVKS